MNRDKAIQFVQQHGDAIEQARLRYLLHGERPSAPVVQQLCNGQQHHENRHQKRLGVRRRKGPRNLPPNSIRFAMKKSEKNLLLIAAILIGLAYLIYQNFENQPEKADKN